MRLKERNISLAVTYFIVNLFIAIFLPQYPFWVILGVSAIFLFLVYLLFIALRKRKITVGRSFSHDERSLNKILELKVGGVLLIAFGTVGLIGSFNIRVEDNYDFTLRAIVLFFTMICFGFGIKIFSQSIRQEK